MLSPYVSSVAQGQAGVFRVASELMFRGYSVYFPCADDRGVDLIVYPNVRIQVKSGHLQHPTTYPMGVYPFKLTKGPIVTGNNTIKKRGPVNFSEKCEFVVLYGIDQGRFWIVPAPLLDGATTISLGPDVQYKTIDMKLLKEMKDEGYTNGQIAELMGVSDTLIRQRLKGNWLEPKRFASAKVREYEGRWDIIDSYSTSIQQALAPVEEQEKLHV